MNEKLLMLFADLPSEIIQEIQERVGNIEKVEVITTGCNSFVFVVHGANTLVLKAPKSNYSIKAMKREIRILEALRPSDIFVPKQNYSETTR
jgi:predicted Ser/Thr protein kinase